MKSESIQTPRYEPEIMAYGPRFKLDKLDRKIIRELDENARKPLSEISKNVGLSRDAVRNRIKKLVDNKVILAFKPIFNPPNLGYPVINYVCISLYNPTEVQEKEFVKFLKSNKHVTYIASLIGRWDYIIDIMAESQGQFEKIMKDIRHRFADLVKDYEIFGVMQEYEYEEHGKLVYD